MTHQQIMAAAFADELEKIAEAGLGERAMMVAPAAAAVPGFLLGASDTQTFDPATLVGKKFSKNYLGAGGSLRSRAVSGLLGAGALGTTAGLPLLMYGAYKGLRNT